MQLFVNPNSCIPASCYLVFNDSAEYEEPVIALGQITLNDGTRQLQVCYADILCGGQGATKVCNTEGTPQESTVTIVTAPSTACCGNTITYTVSIKWDVACGQWVEETFIVVGQGDVPDTVTTVAAALAAKINANGAVPVEATPAAGVITLVAVASGVPFTVSVAASVNGAITTTNTVPNVNPFGSPADLSAMGVPSSAIDPNAVYDAIALTYWIRQDLSTQNCKCLKTQTCWIFVQNGNGAEDDILTGEDALQDILAADTGGSLTVADFIAKQDTFCTPSGE